MLDRPAPSRPRISNSLVVADDGRGGHAGGLAGSDWAPWRPGLPNSCVSLCSSVSQQISKGDLLRADGADGLDLVAGRVRGAGVPSRHL